MKNIVLKIVCITAILSASLLQSCKKDDNKPQNPYDSNPQELITTMKLHFVNSVDTSDTHTFIARDPDGNGGQPLSTDKIVLKANTTYTTHIMLLDETKTPADNISAEVEEEKNDHQFFFNKSGGTDVTVSYLDKDDKNLPVGLSTQWITGPASSGKMQVVLKHQPGVKKGSQVDGETDIQIDFDFEAK